MVLRNGFAAVLVTICTFSAWGKPLIVVVDNNCLQTAKIKAQHKIFYNTHYQALRVESATTENEWRQQACVVNVSEDGPIHAASVVTDPLDAQQAGLAAIHHSAGVAYFYHPIWGIRQPVVTAVVDTGIQATHPDLQSRLWHGTSGEVGYNILTGTFNPDDDNGHGTHVSGLLGAQRGNGIGIQGVMGDLVQLMAVKALDSTGGGNISDVVNGIHWAADHGAEVINLSLAATGDNSSLKEAVEYALSKNIVLVAAAGNLGAQISSSEFIVPAAYAPDHDGLISVGAIDAATLTRPNYSNYSNQYVEIAAPGSIGVDGFMSTYIGSTYMKDKGTSISSPHVAGAASLAISFLKTHGFQVDNATIEQWIEASANTSSALTSDFVDGRFLDLERLGKWMFNSTVIDASGGFDDDP